MRGQSLRLENEDVLKAVRTRFEFGVRELTQIRAQFLPCQDLLKNRVGMIRSSTRAGSGEYSGCKDGLGSDPPA